MRLYAAASNNHIGIAAMNAEPATNRLVTFAYPDTRDQLLGHRSPGTRIMLDSGAFSAHHSGNVITPDALAREAQWPKYDEVVALDDMTDPAKSYANAKHLQETRPDCIATFHMGEDFTWLIKYRTEFTKIGLGGIVGKHHNQKAQWLAKVFAMAWPARFHIFGCHSPDLLMRFPAESADATSWASILAHGFYNSRGASFGEVYRNAKIHLRGTLQDLRELQNDLTARWRETLDPVSPKGYHDHGDGKTLSNYMHPPHPILRRASRVRSRKQMRASPRP